ncbi:MAG: hypothetical protein DWQ07_21085 [Chloroflexi bacterium]|nr:MAG: hypothetical protein DWQ07_21085 [Chloroflexota bacterium]MBL1194578.1 hypothetical protein [Chloroflexota bacterium]NOH11867.1 hypothetical protein [Chloroflexota bacterium]
MGAWFNRKYEDNREPEIIARERQVWRRRWGWTFVMGISTALLGGLIGLSESIELMFRFIILGLILGLVGGWVAGSVDLWSRNNPQGGKGQGKHGGFFSSEPYYMSEEFDEEEK